MQLEVDEPVSPSSSYSGPTMPTQKPPHHPWLMPPPVGYVKPPSLFPDVPRRRVQPSPSWARSDKFPHNNRMDCSDDAANSDDGAGSDLESGDEGHVQIPVGNLGLLAEIFSRNFVSNTITGPSPDNSALMEDFTLPHVFL